METMFRAYDIRGVYGQELTDSVCELIGKAIGTMLNVDEYIVGYDTRTHSPKIFEQFLKGITSTGTDVLSVGMLPNPVIYFNGFINKLPGLMITASHNPPEYNGFKFFRANGSSYTDEIPKIKEIVKGGVFKASSYGNLVDIDYGLNDYREFLDGKIKVEKKIKVVAECFHGVASTIVPYIFETFGIECIPLHHDIKGDFGGLRPEPKGENLNELRKKVVQEKADFGIAFDGDADRSVFIDNEGKEYMASVPGTLFIKDILSKTKGEIIATIDCPSAISKAVEENGGKIFWNRIGHGFIEENLIKRKALFAVEQSSHFYFNQFYPFSDGFLAGLKMAEILSKSDKKFSELAAEMTYNPTEKIYIDAGTDAKKVKVVENLKKQFSDVIDAVDGFKIFLNETEWVMIRTSQNLPEVNLVIEAKDEKRLKEILEKYTKLIKEEIRKA
jgi:phosphomannomutase / phosphoglucomutase